MNNNFSKIMILPAIVLLFCHTAFAQSAREINCFRNFGASDQNQQNINAYLLSYLSAMIYPERLARETSQSTTSLQNDERFAEAFENKFKHWFYDINAPRPTAPTAPMDPSTASLDDCPSLKKYFPPVSSSTALTGTASKAIMDKVALSSKSPGLKVSPVIALKVQRSVIADPAFMEKLKKEAACEAKYQLYLEQVKKYEAAYDKYERDYTSYQMAMQIFNDRVPEFEYFHNTNPSDRRFRDPEAMLISTPTLVIVVFRGTDRSTTSWTSFGKDWGEWILTDAVATPYAPGNGIRGTVHSGFWNSLSAIRSRLTTSVIQHGGKTKKVWITGHSLGGGQAALFASHLQFSADVDVQGIYTFGGPSCVGNSEFANQMKAKFTNSAAGIHRFQRFEHRRDAVAVLPIDLGNFVYSKAGTRNLIDGNDKYYFNRGERTATFDMAVPSFCHHHPEFYINGIHALIKRVNSGMISNLPVPTDAPDDKWEACSPVDWML
jgi:pimeloyl-ACP methyl ester carboxylesterase